MRPAPPPPQPPLAPPELPPLPPPPPQALPTFAEAVAVRRQELEKLDEEIRERQKLLSEYVARERALFTRLCASHALLLEMQQALASLAPE